MKGGGTGEGTGDRRWRPTGGGPEGITGVRRRQEGNELEINRNDRGGGRRSSRVGMDMTGVTDDEEMHIFHNGLGRVGPCSLRL